MNAPADIRPRLKSDAYDIVVGFLETVDQVGREMEERWGVGRLPTLVPLEWGERFASQKRKFSSATWDWDVEAARRHSEAMIRAYRKLDEMATAAGHEPGPPEQWEFETPEGLVILIQDIRRTNQVQRHGRKCQVWSLDEIANVIRTHPILAAAKDAFPGAELIASRPGRDIKQALNDSLESLPF